MLLRGGIRGEDLHALCSVGGSGLPSSMVAKLTSDWVAPDFGAGPVLWAKRCSDTS